MTLRGFGEIFYIIVVIPSVDTMVRELLVEQPRLKTQVGKGLPQRLAHQF